MPFGEHLSAHEYACLTAPCSFKHRGKATLASCRIAICSQHGKVSEAFFEQALDALGALS
jgi:hypothetical protein